MGQGEKATFTERFETCPHCGYENGFHLLLIKDAAAAAPSEIKFQLKCPSCAQTYDLNLYCIVKP